MVRRALDKVARKWGGFDPAKMEIRESGGSAWIAPGFIRVANVDETLDELLYRELSRRTTVASLAA